MQVNFSKKLLSILSIGAVILSLAACTSDTPPTDEPAVTEEPEVITAENIAKDMTASSSDTYTEDVYADCAFDGKLTTKWSPKEEKNTFLEVTFTQRQRVNSIVLYFDGAPKAFSMRYYSDGEWFDIFGTYTEFDENITALMRKRYDFEEITAEKIRLCIDEGIVNVAEMEVYLLPESERSLDYQQKNIYIADDFFDIQNEYGLMAKLAEDMFTSDKFVLAETELTVSDKFVLQNGIWNKSLDERRVFLSELSHASQDETAWSIRVGLGGQIYSINGAFGQAVPSQGIKQEWVDSVMQATAISYTKHNPDNHETTCLLLQSGSYLNNSDKVGTTFYSPLLAVGRSGNTVTTVNWMQQAYSNNVNKSDLLIYTKIRDIGSGAFEVTYTYCNFGDTTYDDLSVPWNAVNLSVLPDHVLGKDNGGYTKKNVTWAQAVNLSDTGGWAAAVQDASDKESMAMAIVFGKNPVKKLGTREQWSDAIYSYGQQDGQLIQNVVSRFKLQPGDVFYYKFYVVIGKLGNVATTCKTLADKVEYGYKSFAASSADTIAYYLKYDEKSQQNTVVTNVQDGTPLFYTYAQPVTGSVPLLLLRDKETGKQFISTEAYALGIENVFTNPYDSSEAKYVRYIDKKTVSVNKERVEYLALLGYVMKSSEVGSEGTYRALAQILDDETYFPKVGELDKSVVVLVK